MPGRKIIELKVRRYLVRRRLFYLAGLFVPIFVHVNNFKEKRCLTALSALMSPKQKLTYFCRKPVAQSLERTEKTLVIIDLTGGYETQCVKAFYQAGFTIHRAEGRKVKSFMRACGQLAKTDSIDARALADYGKRLQDKLTLFQPVDNEIKPYIMRLNELKQLLQMEKNRLQSPQTDNKIYEQVSRHIAFLKTEINFLAKEL